MKYRSARSVLLDLPEVFTTTDAILVLQQTPENTRAYLSRWRSKGLVSSLGPKTGVHFNLVRDPNGNKNHFDEAVLRKFPSAVLGGLNVLHDEGWTTQVPHIRELYVPRRRSYPKVDSLRFLQRTEEWFAKVHKYIDYAPCSNKSLPRLAPSFVLVDALVSQDGWTPDFDDLDFEELSSEDLALAGQVLGYDPKEFYDEEFAAQMAQAKEIMRSDRVVLRELSSR